MHHPYLYGRGRFKMSKPIQLKAHRIGIDTYKQAIVFVRSDCNICYAEGLELPSRVHITLNNHSVIATLNVVSPELLPPKTIGLSEFAWDLLGAEEGSEIQLSHPSPLHSLGYLRAKIFGQTFTATQLQEIINDIAKGYYADTQIASFITACSGEKLNDEEILILTQSMINVGKKLTWNARQVVDKHCVGGLPGNRTTLLVVPIVAAFGLTIPKTSSRAITSPAGTADTMEVLTKVDLSITQMRKVVEQENGCVVWGGNSELSPADDILIRIERILNLDNEGQLVASVLSKKIAAGSTHVIIDIPIGPTAKLRSLETANKIKYQFESIGKKLGIKVGIVFSDGTRPVGRGIGPALEARDVLAILRNQKDAPQDLKERSLMLAGKVLEFAPNVTPDTGVVLAREILESGKAWQKFQAICIAQGGLFEPGIATYQHIITSERAGTITTIDNRQLAAVAKLAGAPNDKLAGIELHVNTDSKVEVGQPLFTIHAESLGGLNYALSAIKSVHDIMQVE
jgi:thymidine phosphorylase